MTRRKPPSGAASVFMIALFVGYLVYSVVRLRGATILRAKGPAAASASASARP